MDLETEFFSGLLELSYGQKGVVGRLKELAEGIPWAKGWPEDKRAFWNAEAFMWQNKIEKEKRQVIQEEFQFLIGKNSRGFPKLNLDLGCGSYSYISSVGIDLAEKMLNFNENCIRKVRGNIEKPLIFGNEEFDSVTAVFVLNYIKNFAMLFTEIKRILKKEGYFVAVLYGGNVNDWQRQKEVHHYSSFGWKDILKEGGFKVDFYEKERLWFFKCMKC